MFYLKEVKYKDILNIDELSIPRDKLTCIVGESGSGKTTLLKLLNNLITADSGEIYYNNALLMELDPIDLRRKVVMLSQTPVIFPGTIKDNLLVGLKLSEKTFTPTDEKLDNILRILSLAKKLNEDTKNLSGGEKQRLALGRILLMMPETILLDEPSSALDEDTEQDIIKKLLNYAKQNQITLIMITHSKKIAQTYSDLTIEMQNGKIISKLEV